MIAVRETSPGIFEPIEGNPIVESSHADENLRHHTPLATLFGENWTDAMRAEFRVALVTPAPVPAGRIVKATRFERNALGQVVQVHDLEPIVVTREMVDAERDRRTDAGMTYTVGTVAYRFQTHKEARENVHGVATMALAALMKGAQPGDFLWHKPKDGVSPFTFISADNSLAQMDAPTAFDFAQTMARQKSALIYAGLKLKETAPIPIDYTLDKYWPA